nr:allatostatin-C [Urechis unicinctus]
MDSKMGLVALVLAVNCLLAVITAASPIEDNFNEIGAKSSRVAFLETKLREDIERELADVMELESQLQKNINMISEKKRQLEIKKREPLHCLVNIVSCWKRK